MKVIDFIYMFTDMIRSITFSFHVPIFDKKILISFVLEQNAIIYAISRRLPLSDASNPFEII